MTKEDHQDHHVHIISDKEMKASLVIALGHNENMAMCINGKVTEIVPAISIAMAQSEEVRAALLMAVKFYVKEKDAIHQEMKKADVQDWHI